MLLEYGTQYLIVGIVLTALSWSQTINPSDCIGPLTAAPNCNSYGSILTACDSLRGSAAASCYCPQTVFDALVRCEGEVRVCFATDLYDSSFEAPGSGLFALWHSACDATLTYSVTTPVAAEPSGTVNIDYCNSVYNDCNRFGLLTDDCTMSYTANSDILSCWCQSSILSLASRCQIDGTSSCFLESVVTSSLWSYQYCRNGASAEGRPTASTPAATVVAGSTATTSVQGGSTTPGTAAPSTLPSVPGLLTSTTSAPSQAAGLAKPKPKHVIAALCGVALLMVLDMA